MLSGSLVKRALPGTGENAMVVIVLLLVLAAVLTLDIFLARRRLNLAVRILVAFFLGIGLGLLYRELWPAQLGTLESTYAPFRELFLRLLRMIIIPLIVASMVAAIANLGTFKKLGSLSWKTAAYYFVTTGLSVLTGIILVNLIRPGVGVTITAAEVPERLAGREQGILEVLINMVPRNPVEAMANMDVLAVIFFSLLFGIGILAVGKEGFGLRHFFDEAFEVMMKITFWIVQLAPIGIFTLITLLIATQGLDAIRALPQYMLTVLLGLGIHAAVTLPLFLYFAGRQKPHIYAEHMFPPLTMAFSTASSAATLPLTMATVWQKTPVPKRISNFVLQIGATINMDGTALYEAVAAIFIAQAYGIHLSFEQQVVIFLTATLAAVGAAAVPEAGLVTMAIVLGAVGIPLEGIALILGVDAILDRFRTAVNVWGDTVGCAVVHQWEGGEAEYAAPPAEPSGA